MHRQQTACLQPACKLLQVLSMWSRLQSSFCSHDTTRLSQSGQTWLAMTDQHSKKTLLHHLLMAGMHGPAFLARINLHKRKNKKGHKTGGGLRVHPGQPGTILGFSLN